MFSFKEYIIQPVEIRSELLVLFGKEEKLVIFDVGACEGEDSIRYTKLFPDAKIFTFEPRPDNLEKIRKNLLHYGSNNIHVFELALSNQNGSAVFYLSSGKPENVKSDEDWDFGNKSSSLLPPSEEMKKHHDWLKFSDSITVPTQTLKDFCSEQEIDRIHFMHLDVQGAELLVLEGSGGFLQKIVSIWMEVEAVELYKEQPLRKEVEAFMYQHNFVRIHNTVDELSGDQFYVNKKLVSEKIITKLMGLQQRKKIRAIFNRYYSKITKRITSA